MSDAILPKSQSAPANKPGVNPSVTPAKRVTEKTRIPMSTRTGRLAVPDLEGFHLHWAHASRVERMLKAGYEFVEVGEVEVNNMDLAGDMGASGNTDLGSRVSISAGTDVDSGRLYLMKIRQEWRDQDLERMEQANEVIAAGIRGGTIGANGPGDQSNKYLKRGQELFIPRNKRKFKGD